MNPEIKAKWLAALASGEFFQGNGALRVTPEDEGTPKHCCLDVLCALSGKGQFDECDNFNTAHETNNSYLPRTVADWAALTETDPHVFVEDVRRVLKGSLLPYQTAWLDNHVARRLCLSELNDHAFSFTQIATVIRELL